MLPTSLEESHISRDYSSLEFLQLPGIALRPPNSHTFSEDSTISEQYSFISSLTGCGWLSFVYIYPTTLPSTPMQAANYINNLLILTVSFYMYT